MAEETLAAIRKTTSIPAEPLDQALRTLAKERQLQLLYRAELVRDVNTDGAVGEYTPDEALKQLLGGTGLTYKYLDASTVTIVPRAASHAVAPETTDQSNQPNPNQGSGQDDGGGKNSFQDFRVAQGTSGQTQADASVDRQKPRESSTAVVQTPQSDTSSKNALQEVIVTADKHREPLNIVPVSMDVVSSEFLNNTSANQLSDYLGYLPNVFYLGNGATGTGRIYIRGISSIGAGSTVGVYIDNAPFGSSTSFAHAANLQPDLDPSLLQQIEVLKGPQGTLYGTGSEGGLIKYVTQEPNSHSVSYGFAEEGSSVDDGSHGGQGYAVRAHGNIPLVEDGAALEATAYYRHDPGFIDNLATGNANDNSDTARGAYASLLVLPSENLKFRLSGLYQSLDVGGLDSVPVGVGVDQIGGVLGPPVFGRYTTYLKDLQGSHTQDQLYVANLDYQLGGATLSSTTSYSIVRNLTGYGDSGFDDADYGLNPEDTIQNSAQSETRKVSEEVRLASTQEGRYNWLLGGFYTHEKSNANYKILANLDGLPDVAATPAGDVYTQTIDSTYSEYSLFGSGTLNAWRQLYLTLGARYSLYDQHYTQTRAGEFGSPGNPGAPNVYADESTSDGAFTYLADLSWRFTGGGSVYFRAASGYRVGGPSALPLTAETPPGFTGRFGPEKLYDYEVGIKQSLFSGKLELAASTFYIAYRNMQGNVLIGTLAVTGNPGNARDYGVELSARARPIEGFTVEAAFGFADATLSQDAPAFGALKGDDLPDSPHFTASLSLSYEHQLLGNLTGFIGGGIHSVSASVGDFSSTPDATYFPAETIVDLHSGLKFKQFTATLYVKNAGNTYEYENDTNPSSNGPAYVSVTRPRTIGLRLSQEF